MKAGDLERNLTHLVEVAKAARACLATVEGEVSALRVALATEVPEVTSSASSGLDRSVMEAVYK